MRGVARDSKPKSSKAADARRLSAADLVALEQLAKIDAALVEATAAAVASRTCRRCSSCTRTGPTSAVARSPPMTPARRIPLVERVSSKRGSWRPSSRAATLPDLTASREPATSRT